MLESTTALLILAEDKFQRGDLEARSLAEQALAASRDSDATALEARAHQLLGEIDSEDLAYAAALAHFDIAVRLRDDLALGDDASHSRATRAVVYLCDYQADEAARDIESVLAAARFPADTADAARRCTFWVVLGGALYAQARYAEAMRLFEAVIAAEHAPVTPLCIANACMCLAAVLETTGDSTRATEMNRRAVEIRTRVIGTPSMRVAFALVGLAGSRIRSGHAKEACSILQQSVEMLRACKRERHPRIAGAYFARGIAELVGGRRTASDSWFKRAMETEERTFGKLHPNSAKLVLTAGETYAARGHHGEAARFAQQAAASLISRVGTRDDDLEAAVGLSFACLQHLERYAAIVTWLEPMVAKLEAMQPLGGRLLAQWLSMLAEAHGACGKLAEAEAVVRRGVAVNERVFGVGSEEATAALHALSDVLAKQGRGMEAMVMGGRAQRAAGGPKAGRRRG